MHTHCHDRKNRDRNFMLSQTICSLQYQYIKSLIHPAGTHMLYPLLSSSSSSQKLILLRSHLLAFAVTLHHHRRWHVLERIRRIKHLQLYLLPGRVAPTKILFITRRLDHMRNRFVEPPLRRLSQYRVRTVCFSEEAVLPHR